MKKILLLFLIIITSCDCTCPSPQEGTVSQENNSIKKLEDYAWLIKELEYDSCEYILVNNKGITHKGNCRFCEERKKKNEKDTVYIYTPYSIFN